ncbi:hypothetical protein TBLA_0H02690 [Henningerozyma blattae CBS 6284]|uniref:DWNN domain-containing protein n=1 Tax=Henningerozyma blattae (strain ATCC 34711 / CBS 6284 / DSM 70876 / NBRC 10599 / NRRL Y-10934 / UCD 77-7) TaxID=1071380 RepID=I2H851_HENB6|nr:hypothetical protein TBLA_0H02690 [Tetrapisispora blattae CBS 6284]CCH62553.1 hypothetical protein TBLA_0H02690 [Tetrapisispora blattae CBS 6284]
MSSTIFYRFRSQKDTSRVLFDGTGLTVFDLKREIIQDNKLGDGTDFQLRLFHPDTEEELDDDTFVIPRSSSVVVKRLPAIKSMSLHGKKLGSLGPNSTALSVGNATRYVSGRPRVFQKKTNALDMSTSMGSGNLSMKDTTKMSEEERIANMFANQQSQWEHTQQEMAEATPVFFKSNHNNQHQENEGPPPPGYMCYRCGARDHWIKNCPTNTDPTFEGKRIRRTTGIPKKFLKTVKIDPDKITPEEMNQRKIMITEDGEFVVQIADEKSWEDYQRKQQNRLITSNNNIFNKNYYNDLPGELKCPITGGLLNNPVRTTKCCNKLFSKNAIEDVLLETDFVCPECKTEDILLDSLIEDKEIEEKVKEFIKSHENDKSNGENINGNTVANNVVQSSDNNTAGELNKTENGDNSDPATKKRKLGDGGADENTMTNINKGNSNLPIPPMPIPPPFAMPPFPMPFMPFMPHMMPPNLNNNNNQNASNPAIMNNHPSNPPKSD